MSEGHRRQTTWPVFNSAINVPLKSRASSQSVSVRARARRDFKGERGPLESDHLRRPFSCCQLVNDRKRFCTLRAYCKLIAGSLLAHCWPLRDRRTHIPTVRTEPLTSILISCRCPSVVKRPIKIWYSSLPSLIEKKDFLIVSNFISLPLAETLFHFTLSRGKRGPRSASKCHLIHPI